MKNKIFISYSHEDIKTVKQFALRLSLRGFELWMDEKNVTFGGHYTTEILKGIHEADIYVVFLSQNSIQSSWVDAEIDFALREKIERKKLIIVPIRLDDVEIPVPLSNIDYIDARFSVVMAADEMAEKLGIEYKKKSILGDSDVKINISSISFAISEDTAIEVGPFNEGITIKDLEEDRKQVLKKLRKKAHGILLNFVSAEHFDFQSQFPKYKNGIYEESIKKISGTTNGSIGERIKVEALVFNPEERKVKRLLEERLNILNINAITFGFSIGLKDEESILDVGKHCLSKLQEEYIILSYDNNEGAKVEIGDDFYLSLMPTESVIKIKLSTKYDWQFEKRMKEFSVIEFVKNLLNNREKQ